MSGALRFYVPDRYLREDTILKWMPNTTSRQFPFISRTYSSLENVSNPMQFDSPFSLQNLNVSFFSLSFSITLSLSVIFICRDDRSEAFY